MLNADIFVSHSLIKDWHQKSQALADDSLARTVYDQLRLNLNLTVATLLTVIYIKNDCSEETLKRDTNRPSTVGKSSAVIYGNWQP